MKLKLHIDELKEIMASFHALTGIRVVIFDTDLVELISYPEIKCTFCHNIGANAALAQKCRASNAQAFEACKHREDVYIYKCHAGLVEAAAPIKNGNRIIGYIMFGQITDIRDKRKLNELIAGINRENHMVCTGEGIKYKSRSQIVAAAKLLRICTDYMLLRELIGAENNRLFTDAKAYIDAHLSNRLRIEDICAKAHTSRTQLYATFQHELGTGIAAYIREQRLKKAKQLLQTSDLTVAETAELSGFTDYNYFSRMYKKRYGISPHKSRKQR